MKLSPKILYQDAALLVVNKPSGLVVNRAETIKGETVQSWVEKRLKINPPPGEEKLKVEGITESEQREFWARSGVVHRLDKDTSGVMVLAKTPRSFSKLQTQFKNREVSKEYLALVHGWLKPRQGDINLPIARNPRRRQTFTIRLGGRMATSFYQVEDYYLAEGGERFSLVRVFPKTGRTHQIRVHFQHLGHPLVTDKVYGGRRLLEDRKWCPRLFLHAAKLTFSHPGTGKTLTTFSPLPKDLILALKHLSLAREG